jgi:hypothetical protein
MSQGYLIDCSKYVFSLCQRRLASMLAIGHLGEKWTPAFAGVTTECALR